MNYYKRIEKSLKFIEDNITNDITLDEIAAVACFSKYHFHRIFSAMVGESAYEYLRRRRLSLASYDLVNSGDDILTIALRYRFESQESFTRSFGAVFGIPPGRYRRNQTDCLIFKKRQINNESLEHRMKGITMEPEIVQVDDFKVIGMKITTTMKDNKIPDLWMKYLKRAHEIKNTVDENVHLGICEIIPDFDHYTFTEESSFSEVVGCRVSSFESVPNGMVSKEVPGGLYAKFTHKGIVANMKATYDYIYGSWLPKSNYGVRNADDFEWYDERFLGIAHEGSEVDIYIPITKPTQGGN